MEGWDESMIDRAQLLLSDPRVNKIAFILGAFFLTLDSFFRLLSRLELSMGNQKVKVGVSLRLFAV